MRQLRHNSGLSYERMARNIYRSKTALAMADKGERIPNWDVVCDYVRACGVDAGELAHLQAVWRAAATRRPAPRQRTATRPARPSPDRATDAVSYVHLLDLLRDSAGLTIRELSERTELPKSTLADKFNVKRLWPRDLTERYLRACDLDDTAVEFWLAVYDRIDGACEPTPADPASIGLRPIEVGLLRAAPGEALTPAAPAAPVAEAVADGAAGGVAAAATADPPDSGTDETMVTSGFPIDATWIWFVTALALAAVVIIVLA
jgi:transcriptional regulator with XRE-family HTH domain